MDERIQKIMAEYQEAFAPYAIDYCENIEQLREKVREKTHYSKNFISEKNADMHDFPAFMVIPKKAWQPTIITMTEEEATLSIQYRKEGLM